MMKRPLKVLASLGHQEVDMGVEIKREGNCAAEKRKS
jgi:hypothetical protein